VRCPFGAIRMAKTAGAPASVGPVQRP